MRENQWTRNDLMARREIVALSRETHDRGLSSNAFGDAVLDAFVDHLNAHHPKVNGNGDVHTKVEGLRESCSRWSDIAERLERERDAAVARAEKAEDRVRALEAAPARSMWCPKILIELLRAQSIYSPDEVTGDAIQTLDRVIAQHRPVGPDGKHGERHTASCGCEDIGAVYPVVEVQARATVADTKLEDEATSFGYWVANQLDCHVDHLDGLTLVEMAIRVVAKAERERDEAGRRTADAEAARNEWKIHHDRVDGQWAKAEREVTKLRRELIGETERVAELLSENAQLRDKASGIAPVVSRADVEKAIRSRPILQRWIDSAELVEVGDAVDAACEAIGVEAEQAVDPVDELAEQIESATRTAIREACSALASVAPGLDPVAVERAMEVTAAARSLAAHVLGQGADQ